MTVLHLTVFNTRLSRGFRLGSLVEERIPVPQLLARVFLWKPKQPNQHVQVSELLFKESAGTSGTKHRRSLDDGPTQTCHRGRSFSVLRFAHFVHCIDLNRKHGAADWKQLFQRFPDSSTGRVNPQVRAHLSKNVARSLLSSTLCLTPAHR